MPHAKHGVLPNKAMHLTALSVAGDRLDVGLSKVMGKQSAVALTPVDERMFLDFLRSIAPIRLLVSSGPTVESLWIESFDGIEAHGGFYIWNTTFAWTPEYGTVTADPSGARNGYRYVRSSGTAPVIEYSRHNFQNPKAMYGRVYWSKYFSGVPAYDVAAFDRWYSVVVRWLRKNGKQACRGTLSTYYLPDAWTKYGEALQSANQGPNNALQRTCLHARR